MKQLFERFHQLCPGFPITYYSKKTDQTYWQTLVDLPVSAIGIDWHPHLARTLEKWSDRFAIQGNIDPEWLFLPEGELKQRLRSVFKEVAELPPRARRGWICGLGHGVLPKTPESSVRLFMRIQKEMFGGVN